MTQSSSFLSPTGYLYVFPGALVSINPGERPGRSGLGHHAGLAPHSLLCLFASHLGHLHTGHHPGNPARGIPALSLIHLVPCEAWTTCSGWYRCFYFLTPQRFQHLCSPAKNLSPVLRHFPINNPLSYGPALPLTEKPKEPITNIIQDHMTW